MNYLKHESLHSEHHNYLERSSRWDSFAKHLGYQPEKYPSKLRMESQINFLVLFDWESRTDEQLLEDMVMHDIFAFKFY